jgi:hypothetical protein
MKATTDGTTVTLTPETDRDRTVVADGGRPETEEARDAGD